MKDSGASRAANGGGVVSQLAIWSLRYHQRSIHFVPDDHVSFAVCGYVESRDEKIRSINFSSGTEAGPIPVVRVRSYRFRWAI